VSTNYLKVPADSLAGSDYWLVLSNVFFQVILRFGVPLFLLISGFVLTQKYDATFSASEFYIKRVSRLIGPYLTFSLLYLVVYGFLEGWPAVGRLFFLLLTASTTVHLWFFRLIIELYLLYPLIMRAYFYFESIGKERLFLFGVLAVQIFMTLIAATYENGQNKYFLEVPQFMAYFMAGIYLSRNQTAVVSWIESFKGAKLLRLMICLFGIVAVLAIFTYTEYLAVGRPRYEKTAFHIMFSCYQPLIAGCWLIFSFAIYDWCARYKNVLRVMASLGQYSFGIYLIHPLFMGVAVRVLKAVHIGRLDCLFYPLLFVLTLILSYAAVWMIHRSPASEVVMNMRRHTGKQKNVPDAKW